MIYRTVDEIPAKIFFKIAETGDLRLLSTQSTKEDLATIWESIVREDQKLTGSKKQQYYFDAKKKILEFEIHEKTVHNCVYVLREENNDEAIKELEKLNYQFTDDLNKDLDNIERYVRDISVKIKYWKKKLPNEKEAKEKKLTNFDQTVISYSIITGLGFIDTNKITQSQFRGLESATKQKVTTLKNGKKR